MPPLWSGEECVAASKIVYKGGKLMDIGRRLLRELEETRRKYNNTNVSLLLLVESRISFLIRTA